MSTAAHCCRDQSLQHALQNILTCTLCSIMRVFLCGACRIFIHPLRWLGKVDLAGYRA